MVDGARRRRAGAALLTLALGLGLSACDLNDPRYPAGTASARNVVTKFFDRLSSGNAAGTKELLDSPDRLNAEAFQDSFYRQVSARPGNAEITEVTKDGDRVRVAVKYAMGAGPAEHSTTFEVRDSGPGESKILAWERQDIRFVTSPASGDLVVNGTLKVPASAAESLVLLPGVYQFTYRDPDALGTTQSGGGAPEAFPVQFPATGESVKPTAADRVSISKGFATISLAPTSEVAEEAERRLQELLGECADQGLLGSSCPGELSRKVRVASERLGGVQVNPRSVEWASVATPSPERGAEKWLLGSELEVRYEWADGGKEVAFVVANLSVSRDESRELKVELAGPRS